MKVKSTERVDLRSGVSGLCCTCRNLPTCSVRDKSCTVVWCEEFEVEPARAVSRPSVVGPAEASPWKGLCANCDERETCRLPRPDTGVWHCECYR